MLAPLQFVSASVVQAAVVLAPAYLYAAVKRSKAVAQAASLTLALYILQAIVLLLPNLGLLSTLKYNWVQKLTAFVLTILAARLLSLKKADCGFNAPSSSKAFAVALLLGVLCTIPSILEDFLSKDVAKFSTEYLLFELSLPGLQEEPLYRGLFLCIWDKAVGRPFKILGVQMGWGVVISTALFVLGHTSAFDKNFHLVLAPQFLPYLDLIVFSLAMAWLRYKYGSVWPAVVAHNLGNTLEVCAGLLLPAK